MMVNNMLTAIAKQAAHQGSFDGISTADVASFASSKLNSFITHGTATTIVKDASVFELSSTNGKSVNSSDLPNIELRDAASRQLFLVHIEVPYNDVALLPPFWIRDITLRGDSVMHRE